MTGYRLDLSYLFVHSAAEVVLLWGCLLGAAIVQSTVVGPVTNLLGEKALEVRVDWLVPASERQHWNFSSFLVWFLLNTFGSFILHLPSLWTRRVQIRRPLDPLDKKWYSRLKKPSWHPSNLFFPLWWIPTKSLKSVVLSLVWEASGRRVYVLPVWIALTAIVVADLWNQVFFVQHDLVGAVIVIWILIFVEANYFAVAQTYVPGAVRLLVPMLVAQVFAAALASDVCFRNVSSTRPKSA